MQDILKYLNDNKEWIFSGIGILALTTLFAIIKKILFKTNDASTMKQINKNHSSGTQIGIQNNYKSEESDNDH